MFFEILFLGIYLGNFKIQEFDDKDIANFAMLKLVTYAQSELRIKVLFSNYLHYEEEIFLNKFLYFSLLCKLMNAKNVLHCIF